jgi:hypothetical protein
MRCKGKHGFWVAHMSYKHKMNSIHAELRSIFEFDAMLGPFIWCSCHTLDPANIGFSCCVHQIFKISLVCCETLVNFQCVFKILALEQKVGMGVPK